MNSKNEDILKKFHESLEHMKGNIHIIEAQIDVDVQMKFYSYSNNLKDEINSSDLEKEEKLLFSEESSIEEKKHSLALISNIPDAKAYRIIEKYSAHPDEEIKDWATLALLKSRITLETDLSDEKQMVISTGLGGKDNKLRFFVLILSEGKVAFTEFQQKTIQREFPYFLEKSNCEIEDILIHENYVTLLILVPIMADLQVILDAPLAECNQYGNFLDKDYVITNVRKIPEPEIIELLNKMK
jgi:hypothetical protein